MVKRWNGRAGDLVVSVLHHVTIASKLLSLHRTAEIDNHRSDPARVVSWEVSAIWHQVQGKGGATIPT